MIIHGITNLLKTSQVEALCSPSFGRLIKAEFKFT
jgi:hypothetical protein